MLDELTINQKREFSPGKEKTAISSVGMLLPRTICHTITER